MAEKTKSSEKSNSLVKVPMKGEIIPKLKDVGFEVVHIHGGDSPRNPKTFYLEGPADRIKEALTADEQKFVSDASHSEIQKHKGEAEDRKEREKKDAVVQKTGKKK